MPILFKCPCGKTLKAPDRLAGKQIKCPNCSKALRLPAKAKPQQPAGGAAPAAQRPPSRPDAEPPKPLDELALDDSAPRPEDTKAEPDQGPPKMEGQPLEFDLETPAEEAPQEPPPADKPKTGDGGLDFELAFADEDAPQASATPPPPPEPEPEPEAPLELDLEDGFGFQAPAQQPAAQPEQDPNEGQPVVEDTDEAYELPSDSSGSQDGVCAQCGAELPSNAVICVKCGKRVEESAFAEEEKPEPKKSAPPPRQAESEGGVPKSIVMVGVFGGVAALLLVGAVFWILLSRRSQPEPVAERPAPAEREERPERPERPRETPERPARRPAPPADWTGFALPAFQRRDAARRLAEAFDDYQSDNGALPESLAAMGLEGDLAQIAETFDYLGKHPADAGRTVILAHEQAPENGVQWAVLCDGSALSLTPDALDALLVRDGPHGRATAAETAVLDALRPSIKVVNERFAELTVLVDGEEAATLEQYASALVPVEEGERRVAFQADGAISREVRVVCRPAMLAEFDFRRHATRPVVPEREIRAAARRTPGRRDPRQVLDSERRLAQLRMGRYDVFHIGDDPIRAVSSRELSEGNFCRALHARIEFEGRQIVGPLPDVALGDEGQDAASVRSHERGPILVNAIERLAEGDVFYPNGAVEHYRVLDEERETRFGSVGVLVTPNPALAAHVRLPELVRPEDRRRDRDLYDDDDDYDFRRTQRRRPAARRGREEAEPAADTLPPRLDFAWPLPDGRVDVQAIRAPLTSLGRPAADALLALALRAAEEPERPDDRTRRRRDDDWDDVYDDDDDMMYRRQQPRETEVPPGREAPAGTVPTPEEALAMAGAYGAPRLPALLPALDGRPSLQRAVAFAIGLTGEAAQAAALAGVGRRDRVAALLGLSAVEGAHAASAMKALAARATGEEWTEILSSAPKGLGPAARARLLEALREAESDILHRRSVLEAVCAFAPGAPAEAALFAALDEPPPPEAPDRRRPRHDDPDDDLYEEDDLYDDLDDLDDYRPGAPAAPPGAEDRRWAARMLVHLGHREAIVQMLSDLQEGQPEARARAVFALREAGDPSLAGPLARGLALEDRLARAAAADALLSMGDEDALESVRNRLEEDGDIAFRLVLESAEDLREPLGDAASARLLASLWRASMKAATPEPEPRRRRDPMYDDDPDLWDDEDDLDYEPRRRGRTAAQEEEKAPTGPLAPVRPRQVLAKVQRLGVFDRELFDAVAEALGHGEASVRTQAMSGLVRLVPLAPQDQRGELLRAAEEQAKQLLKDKETAVAATAVDALARLAAQRGETYEGDLSGIESDLMSGDADRILQAIELAAGFSENETLHDMLASVLYSYAGADDDPQANAILAKLAETLGELGLGESVPLLRQLLLHPDRGVRLAAARALGGLADPGAAEHLAMVVTDSDAQVRRSAVMSLARLEGGAGIAALAPFLRQDAPDRRRDDDDFYDDPDDDLYDMPDRRAPDVPVDDLRATVISYVLRHGTRQAFSGLSSGIARTDASGLRQVTALAADALAEEAREEYARFLEGYLKSESPHVRALAAEALVDLLPPAEALARLEGPADEHPDGILPAAARAAVATGDRAWIPKLQRWYPNTPMVRTDRRDGLDDEYDDLDDDWPVGRRREVREDEDVLLRTRVETLKAIGQLGGSEAVMALRQLLSRKILANMGRTRMRDARGREFAGPTPRDAEVLRALVRAYALTDAPEAVSAIAARDQAYNQLLRPEVVEALGACGHLDPEEARRILHVAMRDPNPAVAAAAADALDDLRNRVGHET